MVLIFGAGAGKPEDLGEVAPSRCPNCHNEVFLHHIRSKKSVSLYFVPVVPYGTDEYLLCPICARGLQISAAQRPKVEAMRGTTASFRRGRLPAAFYRGEVERFWTGLGLANFAGTEAARADPQPTHAVPPQPPPGPPGPPAVASPGGSLADQLAELGRLYRAGVLTADEFTAAKARILRR